MTTTRGPGGEPPGAEPPGAERPGAERPGAERPGAEPRGGERGRLGRYGEDLAVRYLHDLGMEVLARNWRCAHGEVDVVARDGDCVVFCEVKTRRASRFGEPVEAVTSAKVMRLRRLAGAYLASHAVRAGGVRIDVVGVLCRPGEPAVLRHVVGVGS